MKKVIENDKNSSIVYIEDVNVEKFYAVRDLQYDNIRYHSIGFIDWKPEGYFVNYILTGGGSQGRYGINELSPYIRKLMEDYDIFQFDTRKELLGWLAQNVLE